MQDFRFHFSVSSPVQTFTLHTSIMVDTRETAHSQCLCVFTNTQVQKYKPRLTGPVLWVRRETLLSALPVREWATVRKYVYLWRKKVFYLKCLWPEAPSKAKHEESNRGTLERCRMIFQAPKPQHNGLRKGQVHSTAICRLHQLRLKKLKTALYLF